MFVGGVRLGVWGVVLVVCVCVGVGGVVLCRCVCVCDLLIFSHGGDTPGDGRHRSNIDRLATSSSGSPDRPSRIYIYIYTHTHTHTHIYIYIYIYISTSSRFLLPK